MGPRGTGSSSQPLSLSQNPTRVDHIDSRATLVLETTHVNQRLEHETTTMACVPWTMEGRPNRPGPLQCSPRQLSALRLRPPSLPSVACGWRLTTQVSLFLHEVGGRKAQGWRKLSVRSCSPDWKEAVLNGGGQRPRQKSSVLFEAQFPSLPRRGRGWARHRDQALDAPLAQSGHLRTSKQ